jgi:hypothetical protein
VRGEMPMWFLYLVLGWLAVTIFMISISPMIEKSLLKPYKYQEIRIDYKRNGSRANFGVYSVYDGFKRRHYDMSDNIILLKKAKFNIGLIEGDYYGTIESVPNGFKECIVKDNFVYLGDKRLSYIGEHKGKYEVIIDNKKGKVFMKTEE